MSAIRSSPTIGIKL